MLSMPTTGNGYSALTAAISWIEQLLIGNLGTSIAVLAIAGVGFAMLQGYLPVRNGTRVLIGCFILFGAPLIAQGLVRALRGEKNVAQQQLAPTPNIPAPPREPAKGERFDPYAGATVPH
jgi:type IV secretory pathway VirB2 component (pilin)